MDWLNLKDKVYIVTGGSSGIGKAIVKELLNDGAKVVNADLKKMDYVHDNLHFIKTDVTSLAQIENTVKETLDTFKDIDGVINNAGINLPKLLVDLDDPKGEYELNEETFNKIFSINVKSVLLMSQAVARVLAKKKKWSDN